MNDNDAQTMRRVSDLLYEVREGQLVPKPPFQRRLVWVDSAKEAFLQTVLDGLPFPEIFIATGQLSPDSLRRVNWLVDGQQRVTTLEQYYRGNNSDGKPLIRLKKLPPFSQLPDDKKNEFLNYKVYVRDLGMKTDDQVKEVFRRINSTDYALKPMERLHAVYGGRFIDFCVELTTDPFFREHDVFTMAAVRRMRDVAFCVTLVATVTAGYFRRQEENERFLRDFMNDYPDQEVVANGLQRVFSYIRTLTLPDTCRVWQTTDLFTLLVEVYFALVTAERIAEPTVAGPKLLDLYSRVARLYETGGKTAKEDAPESKTDPVAFRYLKAATKASDDKYSRVTRGEIVAELLQPQQGAKATSSRKKKK
jgi:hypothetical protein